MFAVLVVRIDAVQLSIDGGNTWRRAKLETPDSPYAWHPWQLELELPRGEVRILARAIESARENAAAKNVEGYRFTLQQPSYVPVNAFRPAAAAAGAERGQPPKLQKQKGNQHEAPSRPRRGE